MTHTAESLGEAARLIEPREGAASDVTETGWLGRKRRGSRPNTEKTKRTAKRRSRKRVRGKGRARKRTGGPKRVAGLAEPKV